MKKLVVVSLLLFATNGLAATKIDPLVKLMAREPVASLTTMKAFGLSKAETGEGVMAEAIIQIKLEADDDAEPALEFLNSVGVQVRNVINDIVTCKIPLSVIDKLEASEFVIAVEAAKPLKPKMNYARIPTRVTEVQSGSGTGGTAYNGSGVLVGIYDEGIDCQHPDFEDGSGNSRIYSIWNQGGNPSTDGGTAPTEITNSYGSEYLSTSSTFSTSCIYALDGSPYCSNCVGHGSHVSGIAAGSNSTYEGVAPEADILSVKYLLTDVDSGGALSTSLIDGVTYLFKKAQKLGKPIVVNMSIGTSLGAHDGSSLAEVGLDNLLYNSSTHTTDTEKVGRALVNAAGNEDLPPDDPDYDYIGGIHAGVNTSSIIAYEFVARDGESSSILSSGIGALLADVWLDQNESCAIAVNAYGYSSLTNTLSQKLATGLKVETGFVQPGSSQAASNGKIRIDVDFTDDNYSRNGRTHQHALVAISRCTSTSECSSYTTPVSSSILNSYAFDLIFSGTCTGDVWLYPDYTAYTDFTTRYNGQLNNSYSPTYRYASGDSRKTITVPATASTVITVGSFLDRATWVDMNDDTHNQDIYDPNLGAFGGTVNDASVFSSLGPTADGRTKPDILAPGEPIISTLAQGVSPISELRGDIDHWKLAGTSMSSPHVAGIVALMFEKNKCLKQSSIKTFLTNNAVQKSGVPVPDTTYYAYGYGRVNAVGAVNNVTAWPDCVPSNSGDEEGGGGGGKTCSLNKNASKDLSGLIFIVATLLLIIPRRFSRRYQS